MRHSGFRLAIAGSRANDTPRQAANPPKCRPIQPKQAIFSDFHPMGLHFGGHTTSNRDLTTTNRGKLRHPSLRHAGDTRQEGFAWRKTPIATGVGGHRETAGTTSGPTRQRTRRRGCGGRRRDGGPGCSARGRWRGLAGLQDEAQPHVSTPGAAGVEGAGGSGGHGRASRSTTPSEARVWRSRGRPGPPAPGTPAAPETPVGPQRNEAATGCPATASSRSRSAVHNSATSNQAVMST